MSLYLLANHWQPGVTNLTNNIIILAHIYEANVRQKTGRTVIPMQSSAFINLNVSVGYDQISCQVSARVRMFSSQRGAA